MEVTDTVVLDTAALATEVGAAETGGIAVGAMGGAMPAVDIDGLAYRRAGGEHGRVTSSGSAID